MLVGGGHVALDWSSESEFLTVMCIRDTKSGQFIPVLGWCPFLVQNHVQDALVGHIRNSHAV
jgi:hypothetical protein